jgi:hypothetical protein
MHPLLNEYMAELHMRELQREAATERLAAAAVRQSGDHSPQHWLRYLLLGSYTPGYSDRQVDLKQEGMPSWLQRRIHTAIREVGLAALGVGFLAGGFLGTRFGLLPAVLLGGIISLVTLLSIIRRSAILLRERLLHANGSR